MQAAIFRGAVLSVSTTALQLAKFIWTHPANRAHRIRSVARAVAWQLYKRATGRPWDLHPRGAYVLRCYPDSPAASMVLYAGGLPDYDEMLFMQHYLRPGDAFIDCGANIGTYTLYAASLVGTSGAVESFEPVPKAMCRLLENVALNGFGHVRMHEAVVGAENATVQFLFTRDCENRIQTANDGSSPTLDRRCVRLDEELPPKAYAMGKMDLEGAEPLAMQGAQRLLADANPPVWLLEYTDSMHAYGQRRHQFAKWLGQRGYDLALYDSAKRRLSFPPEPWNESCNLLAVSRLRRAEVEARLVPTSR